MKAKLIKVEDGYELFTQGFLKGSTNHGLIESLNIEEGPIRYKLSLKNCQAIERGYDLDELADDFICCPEDMRTLSEDREINSFKKGFQKALELIGDKKFSEDDVMLGWDAGVMSKSIVDNNWTSLIRSKKLLEHRESYKTNLKPISLQQTEWDVEIEMQKVKNETKIVGAVKSVKGSGNKITTYKQIPKLDVDSCLTLKRT